jgi:hypothetical protein
MDILKRMCRWVCNHKTPTADGTHLSVWCRLLHAVIAQTVRVVGCRGWWRTPDFQPNWIPVFISSVQWQPYLMELLTQIHKQTQEIMILLSNTARLIRTGKQQARMTQKTGFAEGTRFFRIILTRSYNVTSLRPNIFKTIILPIFIIFLSSGGKAT